MSQLQYFVGLISGTSIDGVDAVVLAVEGTRLEIISSHCQAYPDQLRQDIRSLAQPGISEIDRLGVVDQQIAEVFAHAAVTVIGYAGLGIADITAIGSHGQTIRHRPQGEYPFTLQIGDPNRIAEITGITTVADFRRRDMAAGGQGAPLAPAFHKAAFSDSGMGGAVVNIGGIANATLIDSSGHTLGYDTGPGNTLMDFWIDREQGLPYDENGDWARTGSAVDSLLQRLLADPYFAKPAPKSTGPEYFSPDWLNRHIAGEISPEDIQRTLLELTATSIAKELVNHDLTQVAICGGGAHNQFLLERLAALLPQTEVTTTERFGIHPDWVEAACFAWLAQRTLAGLPGNEPSATGAAGWRVLGAIYPG